MILHGSSAKDKYTILMANIMIFTGKNESIALGIIRGRIHPSTYKNMHMLDYKYLTLELE